MLPTSLFTLLLVTAICAKDIHEEITVAVLDDLEQVETVPENILTLMKLLNSSTIYQVNPTENASIPRMEDYVIPPQMDGENNYPYLVRLTFLQMDKGEMNITNTDAELNQEDEEDDYVEDLEWRETKPDEDEYDDEYDESHDEQLVKENVVPQNNTPRHELDQDSIPQVRKPFVAVLRKDEGKHHSAFGILLNGRVIHVFTIVLYICFGVGFVLFLIHNVVTCCSLCVSGRDHVEQLPTTVRSSYRRRNYNSISANNKRQELYEPL